MKRFFFLYICFGFFLLSSPSFLFSWVFKVLGGQPQYTAVVKKNFRNTQEMTCEIQEDTITVTLHNVIKLNSGLYTVWFLFVFKQKIKKKVPSFSILNNLNRYLLLTEENMYSAGTSQFCILMYKHPNPQLKKRHGRNGLTSFTPHFSPCWTLAWIR